MSPYTVERLKWVGVIAAIVLVVVVATAVYLWAYDWDVRCLFAECRRLK